MDKKVNIIIVNYNCCQDTLSCIESLLKSNYNNYQIYIIDNNSSDDSIDIIVKWIKNKNILLEVLDVDAFNHKKIKPVIIKEITLIKNDVNEGFGSANNVVLNFLIQHTDNSEYVWLLNPDTVVEKDVILDLVTLAYKKEKVIIGNVIHYFNKPEKILFCGGFKIKKIIHGITRVTDCNDINQVDAITGASLFTNIRTFKKLGLLSEEYFMYWEETDFCINASRKGFIFDINTKSKIFDHVGSVSNNNFLREYLYLLNGLRFYKKYYNHLLPFILVSTFLKLAKALLSQNTIKQKALWYAHIDFFKLLLGRSIDVKKRL